MVSGRKLYPDFQGTDVEYIDYLEAIILSDATRYPSAIPLPPLRRSATSRPSAPSPPPSPSPSSLRDEAIENSDGDKTDNVLEFIPYEPKAQTSFRPAKNNGETGIWRHRKNRELDDIIKDTGKGWALRRAELGLSCEAGIIKALDFMIHGRPRTQLLPGPVSKTLHHQSDPVLQLLDTFATGTVALDCDKEFTTQIAYFRGFLYVSLCCVALHNGTDKDLVDQNMKLYITDASESHLVRLRNGALWVNKTMAEMAKDIGDFAYELFVLWGRSISQYGRLSQVGDVGIAYFKENVTKPKPGVEMPSMLPFRVPFIIKTIAGDLFSISTICAALQYSLECQQDDYTVFLGNYHSGPIPQPQTLPCPSQQQAGQKRQHLEVNSMSRAKRPCRSSTVGEYSQETTPGGRCSIDAGSSPTTLESLFSATLQQVGADQPFRAGAHLAPDNQFNLTTADKVVFSFNGLGSAPEVAGFGTFNQSQIAGMIYEQCGSAPELGPFEPIVWPPEFVQPDLGEFERMEGEWEFNT